MIQKQIPCFPISEKTTWSEWPEAMGAALNAYEKATGDFPPLLLFEPIEEVSNIPGYTPGLSEAPDELVVIAFEPIVRKAVFDALERVESREPLYPSGKKVKLPQIKDNTPIKSIFRQMANMPATVFSLTVPSDGDDSGTIFFLRTPFTISEFRREVQKPI